MEKTATKTNLLPQTNSPFPTVENLNIADIVQTVYQKIKAIHVIAVIGSLAILLGYLSVAPPSDLPNWPLYSLNARTWQFFERWVSSTLIYYPEHTIII